MKEEDISKRKIYTESKTSKISVIVRLLQLKLICQDVKKYNFAK